jgi:hypothetical protein
MNAFFSSLNRLFDLLFLPFAHQPWLAVVAFAAATAVLMLLVYRYGSNQAAIRAAKQRIGAHLLAVRLYQDQPAVVLRSYARLLRGTGGYLLHSLRPLAVLLLPLLLLLAQLEMRLGMTAGAMHRAMVLKVVLAPGTPLDEVTLRLPGQVVALTSPLRIPELREVDWGISFRRSGEFSLEVTAAGSVAAKSFTVQETLVRHSTLRSARWLDLLLYPGEPLLSAPFESIHILYAPRELELAGWRMHWLIPFLVLSLLFGFALQGVMKVEF